MTSEEIRCMYIDLATSNSESVLVEATLAYMRTLQGYKFCKGAGTREDVLVAAGKWRCRDVASCSPVEAELSSCGQTNLDRHHCYKLSPAPMYMP